MLTCPHPPPDETLTLPPISTLTTPYASTPPPLTIFTLLQCPHHSLQFCTPASSSPWLTVLMLLQGPQVMPLKLPSPPLIPPRTHRLPYSRLWMPSRHASYTTYHPYACVVPSQCASGPPHTGLILNPAYDPYSPAVPSQ
ncbi:hypothetical protein O181_059022 [Austropuccinia psidii MF-1]|uniref:Uncharacterized protein n=1 Tax=Austropuccinia psidii MF-1 TaxID=1389203 RepID=A0A9Q3EFV3_9BASI|nr:hypothetical protein [Austropuccinia psidii MF-1]